MQSNPAFQTVDEFNAYMRNKAVEDEEFRSRLLADPKGVIGEELGLTIPDDFTVVIHEDSTNTAHFVLPPSAALAEEELRVATGGGPFGSWCSPL